MISGKNLYNQDFYTWAKHQANMIRLGCWGEVDIENVVEELESMGKQQKHNLISFLKQLIMHLLKWKYQKEKRSNSWINTIENQRQEIEYLMEESPSLKSSYDECVQKAYKFAVKMASAKTGLNKRIFPEQNPFERLLEENYFPE